MPVHPSMIAAMADDTQALFDARSIQSQLSTATGWGTGIRIRGIVKTPTEDIEISHDLSNALTNEETGAILMALQAAQNRIVMDKQGRLKDHYGIEIEDPYHATNDECT